VLRQTDTPRSFRFNRHAGRTYESGMARNSYGSVRYFEQERTNTMSIWTILFVVLLIAWIGGFTVFHVAGGLIHLLLLFAAISLILHFVMGRQAA
jgi:hypothetical protein